MGESLSTWTPSCNSSVRVELSGQRTTSDSGALLLREALDNSGVIEALEDNLVDLRNPLRVRHSLASQLRTLVLQRAMGWIDLSDTDTLRRDPLWQLACSDARGTTPLAQDRPSQATLSRLLSCLGRNDNIDAVHEGLLRLVVWRLTSLKNGERPKQLTLDIDGLPIEVHGHQGGSAYHGLYGARIYSPLVASLAETGDMVGGLLREGKRRPGRERRYVDPAPGEAAQREHRGTGSCAHRRRIHRQRHAGSPGGSGDRIPGPVAQSHRSTEAGSTAPEAATRPATRAASRVVPRPGVSSRLLAGTAARSAGGAGTPR
jgi:hypothetical protein